MDFSLVGKNIRKYRKRNKLTQEVFSEKVGISTNYLGSLERGEKMPSFETFINIVNTLGVSSDMILCDVVEKAYNVKSSLLEEKISKLQPKDRKKIFDTVEFLINQMD